MDILSRLPFLKTVDDAIVDIGPEEIDEEQAKKDRIKFHREKVRNGPVRLRPPTNGQVRRAQVRALRRSTKFARRRQVNAYFEARREAATIYAKLQAVGIAPYVHFTELDQGRTYAAMLWLLERFTDDDLADESGRVELTEPVVRQALQSALNRWQSLSGVPTTPLSPAYELPVRLSA